MHVGRCIQPQTRSSSCTTQLLDDHSERDLVFDEELSFMQKCSVRLHPMHSTWFIALGLAALSAPGTFSEVVKEGGVNLKAADCQRKTHLQV
jgi:hypothetical protein